MRKVLSKTLHGREIIYLYLNTGVKLIILYLVRKMEEEFRRRIVVDQKIMVGKPVIKGTRIPVDAIIRRMAEGMTIKEILEDYPNLTKEDIRAALEYCAYVISGEEIIPLII